MVARVVHPYRLLIFALLSATDLGLTCWLISQSGGEIYESNPLAAWWLRHHGWAGLAIYKAGAVVCVGALVVAISLYRPVTGGRVLGLGCVMVAAVVFYSGGIAWKLQAAEHASHPRSHMAARSLRPLPPVPWGIDLDEAQDPDTSSQANETCPCTGARAGS